MMRISPSRSRGSEWRSCDVCAGFLEGINWQIDIGGDIWAR